VLINLVANARDAMPRGGRLSVTTGCISSATAPGRLREMDGAALLTVSDTGEGMSPDVLARLFEPFFTTKPPGTGTGLGLAVVDRVVRQAGGLVDVASTPGAGTTFSVALPAAGGEMVSVALPVTAPAPSGGQTVLVVDDEMPVRQLAVTILAQCGHVAIEAGSVEEALVVAAGHDGPIDLLLTDVVMPGGSPGSIVDGLVARQGHVRVLYMSGYPADEMVRRGVATGVSSFIQKPFTPDGLARRVRTLLQAPVSDGV
jgi:CheY-like chemotaxis protein